MESDRRALISTDFPSKNSYPLKGGKAMSGKKGFILCVCQGTGQSFTKMDIFGVLSDIRRGKLTNKEKQ